ncbi:MAG TPA: DegT/DnrJ/EryC1/StrS family aminotransferase [Candidatus Ozemobacteraceae bacterium]|nr:DegT/DnrJ/EryC1/StrS family aminotransferase [Candidatus Ozemobacteraceae bacterium]
MSYKVRFVDPGKNYQLIKEEIDAAYFEIMSKGELIYRSHLKNFEKHLAEFVGTKYAVGLNSGYHALALSLIAAGIKDGDEVIVPAHTFVATCSAAVHANAKPVLVDVDRDFNIDIKKFKAAITKKTRAVIPVHLNGRMADMDAVMEIAKEHDLIVIEDACQSLGAHLNGRKAGSIGHTGCWSFYPFKILGGYGDGGALTTNDPEIARKASLLRFNGEDRETGEYHYHGYTCLLDNMQAAFLDIKLRHLPEWIKRRRAIADMYLKGLDGVGDLALPHYSDKRFFDVYQNYVVRTKKRDAAVKWLKENGVETLVHWRKPYYRHEGLQLEKEGFTETEAISAESISLPMNVEMSNEDAQYVIETLRSFYKQNG